MSKQDIINMYKDFSVRFSNRLLDTLISSAKDDDNVSFSPSRLQYFYSKSKYILLAHLIYIILPSNIYA